MQGGQQAQAASEVAAVAFAGADVLVVDGDDAVFGPGQVGEFVFAGDLDERGQAQGEGGGDQAVQGGGGQQGGGEQDGGGAEGGGGLQLGGAGEEVLLEDGQVGGGGDLAQQAGVPPNQRPVTTDRQGAPACS